VRLIKQPGGLSLPPRIAEQLDLSTSPHTSDFCEKVEGRRRGFPGQQLFIDRLFGIGNIYSSESLSLDAACMLLPLFLAQRLIPVQTQRKSSSSCQMGCIHLQRLMPFGTCRKPCSSHPCPGRRKMCSRITS